MSYSKFKTLRHIETVRNYINNCIMELLRRGETHDQTKMQPPEVGLYAAYTPKLRGLTYGSPEYVECCKHLGPALEHHYKNNSHHPEYYKDGIQGMNLFDLLEMIVDWKASGMRHDDGDLMVSIDINAKRFNMSPELVQIFKNTAKIINDMKVNHHAEES